MNWVSNMLSGFTSSLGSGDGYMSAISTMISQNTTAINAQQMLQNSQINIEQTQLSMQAAAEKSEWNKWKIVQDTQNKIYEIQQTVTVDKAKTQDKMFNKWDEYVKS